MKQEQTETSQPARQRLLMAAVLGVLITLAGFLMTAAPPAAAQESNDAPGASTGLVLAPGNAKLTAGWNPPEDNGGVEITGYTVQYKTTGAPDRAGISGDPATGWVDAYDGKETDAEITGLTNDAGYEVRVRASNSAGDGQWSATASATPHEGVIWSAILTVDVNTDYGRYGCTDHRTPSFSMVSCSDALTDDEFVFEGETYQWGTLYDLESLQHDLFRFSGRVPADSDLRKGKLQFGSFTVSLDDPIGVTWVYNPRYPGDTIHVTGSAHRQLNWATTKGQRVPLSLQATAEKADDSKAPDPDKSDIPGPDESDTPGPDESTTAPGAPVGLVLALGNGELIAGWNPPEDDGGAEITSYEAQYKTASASDQAGVFGDPASGWVDAGHSGTGTDTDIASLTNGVGYDVRVRASSSVGDGQWSATASATPHEDVIWSAILTVDNDYGDGTGDFGCVIDVINSSIDDCSVALTEDEFAFGLDTYGWTQFNRYVLPGKTPQYTTVGLSALVPEDSNLRKGRIQVGSELVSLDDTVRVQWFVPDPDTYRNMQWIYSGFLLYDDPFQGTNRWTEGQRVPLSLQAKLPQLVIDETPPGLSSKASDATLSALAVSDGSNDVPLTPAFASDTTGYTASVPNSVSSVTVTPVVNDLNAAVTVEDSAVTSGTPSSPIALTAGTPKAISVVVTAQDGTTKTYTVTVTRENDDANLPAKLQVSDDGGLPEVCRQRYPGNVDEGLRVCQAPYEGGEAILMLTLSGPAPVNGTTVTLATNDQTASSDDFTMPSTITIGEGETSGVIIIAITRDDVDEDDESIYIYACIRPGCDPLNPIDGEKLYNHGIVIPGTRAGGV